MFKKRRWLAAAVAVFPILASHAIANPVIPGAIGFGIETPAGRGGEIIRVTNLNSSGEGSLRACISASGPRVCVFEVSGTIQVDTNLLVSSPFLTIAGQTAPMPGIMIRGAALEIRASDVLVQHIAVRAGDAQDGPIFQARDALKIVGKDKIEDIVIDHCSFSWGIDENVEVYDKWDNVTISNTIISEPLRDSFHPKGAHGLGVLINADVNSSRISMIGNLIAHSHARNPRSSAAQFVLVNNVVYNARGSEGMLFNDGGLTSVNSVVGNVFIKGPDSYGSVKPIRLVGQTDFGTEILSGTKIYVAENIAPSATDDPWSIVDNQTSLSRLVLEVLEIPIWPDGLEPLPTEDVVDYVLQNAGARPAVRNDVDASVVADVRNGTGRIINCVAGDGSNRCRKNAGGWPDLAQNVRRLDIPQAPNADDDGDGYTNAEEWLHAFAAEVEGRTAGADPDGEDPPTTPTEPSPPKPPQLQALTDAEEG